MNRSLRQALFASPILMLAEIATASGAERLPELIPETQPPPKVDFAVATDFDALRLAYAKRADFSKQCETNRPGKQFMERVNQKDFSGATQISEEWLAHCPVDARVHLWSFAAYQDAGNQEQADLHRRWFEGLTDSALKSGDGKTTGSPIVTISTEEEYAVLARLRLEFQGQSLITGTKLLDAMDVKDEHGKASVIYFNPEWHFIRLAHRLSNEKP